ncbi:MAG TPA: ABC transporter permease, partial [Oscillospiraceae bacterium]|nr:ABC transporter permease [Oscillospiraceae bacterium]
MYIVRNALRNIMRSKGRNILIGIIVLVIAVSSCVALSIKQSAAKVKQEGLDSINITAQITINRNAVIGQFTTSGSGDRESFRQQLSSISGLSLDELEKYAAAPSVSDFYYTVTGSVNSGDENIEPFTTETTSTESTASESQPSVNNGGMTLPDGMTVPGGMTQGRGFSGMFGTQGDFSITGYSSETAMTDFINGTCKVSGGTMIDLTAPDMTCLITDELAAYNGLTIGSSLTISNPNNTEELYTLTVNGIYTNSNSGSFETGMRFSTSTDSANLIIVSAGTLSAISAQSEAAATETSSSTTSGTTTTTTTTTTALRTQLSGTYVLADAAAYESFAKEAVSMGLSDTYTVTSSDLTNYEQSLVPLENLSKFAGVFLIVVLLIGGIILVVLNIFNIRERKYEVGVLTAIGMKKSKVAIQFVTEVFAVTFVFIILGAIIGSVVSVPVSNTLLASQIT